MEELKLSIHETLCKHLKDYIPVQELTHAANEICKTVKEQDGAFIYNIDTLEEMHTYLQKADKEYYTLQTVNTKPLTNNQVALAINEVKKLFSK